MANNESTAINALLHNLSTRPVEEPGASDDLFVTAPPARPAAPARAARGTGAPPVRDSVAEQTEVWNALPPSDSVRAKAIEFVKQPIKVSATPKKKIVYSATSREVAAAIAEVPSIVRQSATPSRRPGAPMPTAPVPAPSVSRTGYHIAKEVLLSTTGLALVAILALGVGVYLAIKTRGEPDAPKAVTERDRAVAIMTNAPVPELAVHASAPTVTPISASPTIAAIEPAAPAINDQQAEASDDEISESDIEIEANTPAPRKKRVKKSRVASAAIEKAKPVKAAKADVDTSDPVLAAIHEKPKKITKPTGPATEIASVKGAAPAKGSGSVSISSNVKAVIYVDGRPTGKSSPSSLIMPAGDHQITLLDPDTKKAKTSTVAVAANKSVAIRKDFN